jgi:hypothetical protein
MIKKCSCNISPDNVHYKDCEAIKGDDWKERLINQYSKTIDYCDKSEPRLREFLEEVLHSHRLSLKEELMKKLPKECEFDCKEIINQVLKEK